MTTTRMNSTWVQWDANHTTVLAWGTSQVEWVGDRSLTYSYQDGWTGANPPRADVFPHFGGVRFDFGDGSVRFVSDIADGTSNTLFASEVTGATPFSGSVLGITDNGTGKEYYIGLDAALPVLTGLDDGSVNFFFTSLRGGASPITGGSFGPGEPILLDGTSNTILVTENDSFEGGDRSETWRAGIGRDTLSGGAGRDVLYGEDGNDRIYGGVGDDTLMGGAQNDVIGGGGGRDLIYGGTGDDGLYGSAGNDRIFGGDPSLPDPQGNDDLFGGGGDDSLYGGAGQDIVDGGAGNDLLVLGTGADAIVFAHGSGHDTVADFSVADGDVLQVNANIAGIWTTGAEVIAAFATTNTASLVVLDFGGGDVIDIHAAGGTGLANLADQIIVF